MRLTAAGCEGYKRFKDLSEMQMHSRLICIVGPNAAGKSSYLDALVHLSHDGEFEASERTRGIVASAPTRVTAQFELDSGDRDLIATIQGGAEVRTATLSKTQGVGRRLALEPAPSRGIGHRAGVQRRLDSLTQHSWLAEVGVRDSAEGVVPSLNDLVGTVLAIARSEDQTLDPDHLRQIDLLDERLHTVGDLPHRFRGLPRLIRDFRTKEWEPHPYDAAVEALWNHLPTFLKFEDESRELRASYDVLNETPDVAIRNLLQLAGTTWEEAVSVVQVHDPGQKTEWLDRTREALANVITTAWGQQDLTVRFDLDGSVLNVLMSMQERDWIAIDQHSDGLRQFVALRAFVALRGSRVKPIVLIDEAETHLHYDAQADLVRVLEEQEEAAKVIYTTHSAGCLPRDLGVGIRAVVPVVREDGDRQVLTDHSRCLSRFWSHGSDFSPLLIAMGASAFAFSATQKAAVTEGVSDALLLPTLIREATGEPHLGYQVVPGFSEARPRDIPQFDLLAARVGFVADSDSGGQEHVKKLIANSVKREQIAYLGGRGNGLTLEDFVRTSVYVDAVNAELTSRWRGVQISAGDVPTSSRARALDALMKGKRDADGKTVDLRRLDVAQRLLDMRPSSLVAPRRKAALIRLDQELESIFARATHRLGAA
jgi:AAA domain, putative AbiEii toxin, Type IV TA system